MSLLNCVLTAMRLSSVSLPRNVVCWSVVCNCGISWSYSLACCSKYKTLARSTTFSYNQYKTEAVIELLLMIPENVNTDTTSINMLVIELLGNQKILLILVFWLLS